MYKVIKFLFIMITLTCTVNAQQVRAIIIKPSKGITDAVRRTVSIKIRGKSVGGSSNNGGSNGGGGDDTTIVPAPDEIYTFNLAKPVAASSAGIFANDGTLVRTLWNNEPLSAGKNYLYWDKKDDAGNVLTGTYTAKIIYNNFKYTWEGLIGNTSDSLSGPSKWRSFQGIYDMAIAGNTAYFAMNYVEAWTSQLKADLTKPQHKTLIQQGTGSNAWGASTMYVDTDSNIVYWAACDPNNIGRTYGLGTYNSNDAMVDFSVDTAITNSASRPYSSVIDYVDNATNKSFSFSGSLSFDVSETRKPVLDSVRVNGVKISGATMSTAGIVTLPGSYSTTANGTSIVIYYHPTILMTGIAVQHAGNYLFIARGLNNSIHVVNKTTGAFVRNISSFTNPRSICTDFGDNLWVISGTNTIEKFIVNSDGTLTTTGVTIPGLVDPLKMRVSRNNATIAITDGGSSQQVKAFNNATGASVWTLGQQGGYHNNALVYDDKFYFTNRTVSTNLDWVSFIAFQSDGSFWVGDGGNFRAQHFDANRNYINNIMYLPRNYSMVVDPSNPTRVFCRFLEFEVDHSKPLAPNNGSWKLKRSWNDLVPNAFYPNATEYNLESGVFKDLVTLSNGKTYAMLFRNTPSGTSQPTRNDLLELTDTAIRNTGINFQTGTTDRYSLMPDGSLRIFSYNGSRNGAITWSMKPPASPAFDASNNPQWGSSTVLATIPSKADSDPFEGVDGSKITSGGIIPSFDIGKINNAWSGGGYHLAGIKTGKTAWNFRTSPATFSAYSGDFPTDGVFDIGNNVNYPGGVVSIVDSLIVWNYRGENWKQSQTTKFNIFHENGLMVGQFGVATPDYPAGTQSPAGVAGNVLAHAIVKANGVYYLYNNEESPHSGLHRWRIDSLNTFGEVTLPVSTIDIPSTPVSDYDDMLAGVPAYGNSFPNGTGGWSWTTIAPADTNIIYVKNGTKVYKPGERSLEIKYVKALSNFKVTKSLGNVNSSAWEARLKVNFTGNTVTWNNNDNMYFKILDVDGKIIHRFKMQRASPTAGVPVDLYSNNSIFQTVDLTSFTVFANKFRDIVITPTTFKFADYPTVSYTPFDPTAKVNQPASFEIEFFNTVAGDNRNLQVSIKSFAFKN